jgi:PAS domain S-box-containing protein
MRLLLLETAGSCYSARIEDAATEAGLTVHRLENLAATPPDAPLVGVGPSIRDPLQVARHLRSIGGRALLVFFIDSSSARSALQAELIRDPFLYSRYELIEILVNPRQFAARMERVVEHVQRQLHAVPGSRRRGRRAASRPPRRQSERGGEASLANSSESGGEPYLANIVACASDAIFATDDTARVTMWNHAAERLFGFTAAFALGQTLDFLDPPDTSHRQLVAVARRVLASVEPEFAHVRCGTASSVPIEIAASVAPVRGGPEKTPSGLSVIARDDTEHQRLEDALRNAVQRNDEFLAIMSHELRTPLTSILGYTDMLLRGLAGPLAPITNKYVGNVRSAGDRLVELVNGLLDYTRLEAGAERLERRAISLAPLVKHSVVQFQAQAERRQIDLRVVTKTRLGRVQADADKIGHVLRSYLANALKFTPNGGRIAVSVGRDPGQHDAVRVSVADSGIGLGDEQLLRVWDRFYQGDASLTRPYGGMGLGLAIAQQLVTLQGGSVGAESGGPGKGSTFWFSLPLARPS